MSDNLKQPYYLKILLAALAEKQTNNRRYSRRAFARFLDIDPGSLSRLLAQKEGLSPQRAATLAEKLSLTKEESKLFISSSLEAQNRQKLSAVGITSEAKDLVRQVPNAIFERLKQRDVIAVLEMTTRTDFVNDDRWIAKQLGLNPIEVKQIIADLKQTGLLANVDGNLVKTNRHIATADRAVTSRALKEQQRQFLNGAIDSLMSQDLSERSHTGMTMSIDPQKIPIAKKMIEEFAQELCQVLESGERTAVYQLNISLFSLQKPRNS